MSVNEDGSKKKETSGSLESWTIRVTGYRRAGLFGKAVADYVKQYGRSADVYAFASNYLAVH